MKQESRIKRHLRIRKYIYGTEDKPRLAVFRSSQHIYAQIIDDKLGKTLVSGNDFKMTKEQKMKRAYEVGKTLAKKALKIKIRKVVFDRGGFLYHGRIAELGKGAREGGLEF
ncbi:50S ribosomal protein L18 [Candidatus Daviesbacteria bacterium]|nr:50S ribosomal protein L18 [Candidatus Daviesbacteria bacterium]